MEKTKPVRLSLSVLRNLHALVGDSVGVHKWDYDRKALRDILRRFVDGHTDDEASRVVADVLGRCAVEAYGRDHKLHSAHPCAHFLVGKKCTQYTDKWRLSDPPCQPPSGDHLTVWTDKDGAAILLSQPYHIFNMKKEVEFCDAWGLQMSIRTWPGFHFYGHVLSVEYKLR